MYRNSSVTIYCYNNPASFVRQRCAERIAKLGGKLMHIAGALWGALFVVVPGMGMCVLNFGIFILVVVCGVNYN